MEVIKNGGFVKVQIDNINANFAEASTGIGNAQSAASNAQTTANEAKTAAQTAQNTAESAATAASNANTAAGNAQSTANAAQGAAETAQSTAEAAQTAANEAKAQAQAVVSTIAIGSNAWTDSGSDKVFTTAANGKKPLAVMRKNGTKYNAVLVDVAIDGTNIVVTSSEAFEGYIVVA